MCLRQKCQINVHPAKYTGIQWLKEFVSKTGTEQRAQSEGLFLLISFVLTLQEEQLTCAIIWDDAGVLATGI
jgi:hypothetical protein